MNFSGTSPNPTLDEIINNAIACEQQMKEYYQQALNEVGPDVRDLLTDLTLQHDKRINRLKELLSEIEELRELNSAIAD